MNEQLKAVRKESGLSQESFGERINLSRSHIASLENASRNLTDRIISDICREFSINEDWLRSGQGEMFVETEGTYLSELSRQYDLDELDQVILESYLALTKGQRNGVKDFFKSIAKSLDNEEVAASIDIDEELDKYRLELEAEQKGATLSASEDTKGIRRHSRETN